LAILIPHEGLVSSSLFAKIKHDVGDALTRSSNGGGDTTTTAATAAATDGDGNGDGDGDGDGVGGGHVYEPIPAPRLDCHCHYIFMAAGIPASTWDFDLTVLGEVGLVFVKH
jgi:hypothetical protein